MKKKIHLFFRKPSKNVHYSVENFYKEIFKDIKDENFEIKTKICPLSSRGIFNRIYLIFWAFFNQGDINHVTGDINFISLFESTMEIMHAFETTSNRDLFDTHFCS